MYRWVFPILVLAFFKCTYSLNSGEARNSGSSRDKAGVLKALSLLQNGDICNNQACHQDMYYRLKRLRANVAHNTRKVKRANDMWNKVKSAVYNTTRMISELNKTVGSSDTPSGLMGDVDVAEKGVLHLHSMTETLAKDLLDKVRTGHDNIAATVDSIQGLMNYDIAQNEDSSVATVNLVARSLINMVKNWYSEVMNGAALLKEGLVKDQRKLQASAKKLSKEVVSTLEMSVDESKELQGESKAHKVELANDVADTDQRMKEIQTNLESAASAAARDIKSLASSEVSATQDVITDELKSAAESITSDLGYVKQEQAKDDATSEERLAADVSAGSSRMTRSVAAAQSYLADESKAVTDSVGNIESERNEAVTKTDMALTDAASATRDLETLFQTQSTESRAQLRKASSELTSDSTRLMRETNSMVDTVQSDSMKQLEKAARNADSAKNSADVALLNTESELQQQLQTASAKTESRHADTEAELRFLENLVGTESSSLNSGVGTGLNMLAISAENSNNALQGALSGLGDSIQGLNKLSDDRENTVRKLVSTKLKQEDQGLKSRLIGKERQLSSYESATHEKISERRQINTKDMKELEVANTGVSKGATASKHQVEKDIHMIEDAQARDLSKIRTGLTDVLMSQEAGETALSGLAANTEEDITGRFQGLSHEINKEDEAASRSVRESLKDLAGYSEDTQREIGTMNHELSSQGTNASHEMQTVLKELDVLNAEGEVDMANLKKKENALLLELGMKAHQSQSEFSSTSAVDWDHLGSELQHSITTEAENAMGHTLANAQNSDKLTQSISDIEGKLDVEGDHARRSVDRAVNAFKSTANRLRHDIAEAEGSYRNHSAAVGLKLRQLDNIFDRIVLKKWSDTDEMRSRLRRRLDDVKHMTNTNMKKLEGSLKRAVTDLNVFTTRFKEIMHLDDIRDAEYINSSFRDEARRLLNINKSQDTSLTEAREAIKRNENDNSRTGMELKKLEKLIEGGAKSVDMSSMAHRILVGDRVIHCGHEIATRFDKLRKELKSDVAALRKMGLISKEEEGKRIRVYTREDTNMMQQYLKSAMESSSAMGTEEEAIMKLIGGNMAALDKVEKERGNIDMQTKEGVQRMLADALKAMEGFSESVSKENEADLRKSDDLARVVETFVRMVQKFIKETITNLQDVAEMLDEEDTAAKAKLKSKKQYYESLAAKILDMSARADDDVDLMEARERPTRDELEKQFRGAAYDSSRIVRSAESQVQKIKDEIGATAEYLHESEEHSREEIQSWIQNKDMEYTEKMLEQMQGESYLSPSPTSLAEVEEDIQNRMKFVESAMAILSRKQESRKK